MGRTLRGCLLLTVLACLCGGLGCDSLSDSNRLGGGLAGLLGWPPPVVLDSTPQPALPAAALTDAQPSELFGADPNPNCTITIEEVGTWTNAVDGIKRPSPSNTKKLKATVMPAESMVKIKFKLVNTSKEKGTTLNAGNVTDFDLTFENQAGYANPAGTKQEIVEDNATDNTATVTVTAHDYGAYGLIAAEIVEGGCTPKTSKRITVLKDANTNHIEDEWDSFYAGTGVDQAADSDKEADPTLGGVKGDWLTRYEEYRGFIAQGEYRSTDPKTKTWFWCDLNNIENDTPGATDDMNACVFECLEMYQIDRTEVLGITARDEDDNAPAVVNANRTSHTIHRQQAAPISNSTNTGGSFGATLSDHTPDGTAYCRINVPKHKRKVVTSAAINATQNYVPVKKNTNGGDELIVWEKDGRISVEDEHIKITGNQSIDARSTLLAGCTASATVILLKQKLGEYAAGSNFGIIESEQILFPGDNGVWQIDGVVSTTLTAAVNDTVTILPVANAANFNFTDLDGAWVVVDSEQMKLTAVDVENKKLTVTRHENGTAATMHANGAAVKMGTSLRGVMRGRFDTTAAAHDPDKAFSAPRCFYGCTRGANGTTAAAHGANKDVAYFYTPAQTAAAIAMTMAHEASHTLIPGDGHLGDDAMFIMKTALRPGAYDGHGVYHQHSNESLNKMRLRLP